jgi:hypothetical protein
MFIKFENINDFNTWHETIMTELGIPDGQGTTAYSEAIVHPIDGTVAATADDRALPYIAYRTVFNKQDLFDLGYREYPTIAPPY